MTRTTTKPIAAPSAASPPADRPVTAAELLDHPEWGRCELVRGTLTMMSPAGAEHGELCFEITLRLGNFVKERKLGKVFGADTGFYLARDPDTVRAPDIMFFSAGRLPSGKTPGGYLDVAPDLAVEVVSPSDRWTEVTEKIESYIAAGVKLVWVVEPESKRAHVYRPGGRQTVVDVAGSLDGEDVLPGFALPLRDLFGGTP